MPAVLENKLDENLNKKYKKCNKLFFKPSKCDYCKQYINDDTIVYSNDRVDVYSEEFVAITDSKLALCNDKSEPINEWENEDFSHAQIPQYKLTNFSIYDKNGHLCAIDSGLIEKNIELLFSGTLKPIYSEDPSVNDGVDVKHMGPINAWRITGFDGGENILIGITTAFADYFLTDSCHRDYSSIFDRTLEKLYLTKMVIEFLSAEVFVDAEENMGGKVVSYEDLVSFVCSHLGSKFKFTEEHLLKHSQFIVDQVQIYDEFAEDYDSLLILSPCLRTLIEFGGVDLETRYKKIVRQKLNLGLLVSKSNTSYLSMKYNQECGLSANHIINVKGRTNRLLSEYDNNHDDDDGNVKLIVRNRGHQDTSKFTGVKYRKEFDKNGSNGNCNMSVVTPMVKSVFQSVFNSEMTSNERPSSTFVSLPKVMENNGTRLIKIKTMISENSRLEQDSKRSGVDLESNSNLNCTDGKIELESNNNDVDEISDVSELESTSDLEIDQKAEESDKNIKPCIQSSDINSLKHFLDSIPFDLDFNPIPIVYYTNTITKNIKNLDFSLEGECYDMQAEVTNHKNFKCYRRLTANQKRTYDDAKDNLQIASLELKTGDFIVVLLSPINDNDIHSSQDLHTDISYIPDNFENFVLLRIAYFSLSDRSQTLTKLDCLNNCSITIHAIRYLRSCETILGETGLLNEIFLATNEKCMRDIQLNQIFCKINLVKYLGTKLNEDDIVQISDEDFQNGIHYKKCYDSKHARFEDIDFGRMESVFYNSLHEDIICPICELNKNDTEFRTPFPEEILEIQSHDSKIFDNDCTLIQRAMQNIKISKHPLKCYKRIRWKGQLYNLGDCILLDANLFGEHGNAIRFIPNNIQGTRGKKMESLENKGNKNFITENETQNVFKYYHKPNYLLDSNSINCEENNSKNKEKYYHVTERYHLRSVENSANQIPQDFLNIHDLNDLDQYSSQVHLNHVRNPEDLYIGKCLNYNFSKYVSLDPSEKIEYDYALYPELYRKTKNSNCKKEQLQCNQIMTADDCPKPLAPFQILNIFKQSSSHNTNGLNLILRKFYRPEDTLTGVNSEIVSDFNVIYSSDDVLIVPFHDDLAYVKCLVKYRDPNESSKIEGNISNMETNTFYEDDFFSLCSTSSLMKKFNSSDLQYLPKFYFEHHYDAFLGKLYSPPIIPSRCTRISPYINKKFMDNDEEFIPTSKVLKNLADLKRPLKCMDIFAGCGGLSNGLELSGVCESHWAIENDIKAANSFRVNHPKATVYTQNCNKLLRMIMEGNKYNENGQKLPDPKACEVEFLCGGPPCQGFSGMNRFNYRSYSKIQNSLIATMLSYCEVFQPKYFLLENVKNFVYYKNAAVLKLTLSCLVKMGYNCSFGILQAGSYGIPQSRKRAFIIASKSGLILPSFPKATHTFPIKALATSVIINGKKYSTEACSNVISAPFLRVTIRDGICDLPEIKNGCNSELMPYSHSPQSHYQKLMRTDFITDQTFVMLKDHICKEMSPLVYARICHIPTFLGADWRDLPNIEVDLIDGNKAKKLTYTHNDKKNGVSPNGNYRGVCVCAQKPTIASLSCGSYRQSDTLIPWCLPHTSDRHAQWAGLYGRLAWQGFHPTTVTNPEPMGKQGRVLHPYQARCVSVRECARSQGFSDSYVLCGSDPVDKHRQIGNAVPPPLAKEIGKEFFKAVLLDRLKKL
ncbi:DNA (cytosine-5)-methyltransferase 1-like [Gordionus sp. m RMFG-2023]|uniref:DNA (cytosine-5)-methyltransferase 1-like n=1 Tax=Gordionus sp. m RMFG-2023 TaxID=3053472 RepID=UPI0031FE2F78